MARGWESKAVEAQQEEAGRGQAAKPRLTREEADHLREKETLELSLKDILEKLKYSENPRYRQMLEQTKMELERKLKSLSQ
jgi:hypothetical protein